VVTLWLEGSEAQEQEQWTRARAVDKSKSSGQEQEQWTRARAMDKSKSSGQEQEQWTRASMSQLNARLEIVVGSRKNHWIVCRRVELGRHHVLNKVKCVVHNAVNLMWRFCKCAARGARVFEWCSSVV
jgi:hypothetical protein